MASRAHIGHGIEEVDGRLLQKRVNISAEHDDESCKGQGGQRLRENTNKRGGLFPSGTGSLSLIPIKLDGSGMWAFVDIGAAMTVINRDELDQDSIFLGDAVKRESCNGERSYS